MSLISVFSLAIALFILAITPGPGVFTTISRTLASGFTPSLILIAGLVTGDIIFLLFAILGMSVIAQVMGNFFTLIKITGGLYLIFLGVKIWRTEPVAIKSIKEKKGIRSTRCGNYLSGLLVTLSNPKVILFYCGFLPTFMDLSSLNRLDICMVVLIDVVILSSVFIFYAYIAHRARLLFSGKRAVGYLNKTAGCVMITVGAVIAVKS